MPQVTIQKGQTLGQIAQQHGTTVADLMGANKGNPSVKNANLIIAGGNLNIPEKVGTPAAGPVVESVPGAVDTLTIQNPQAQSVGDLTSFRIALRAALGEAAQTTARNRIQSLSGLIGGGATPNVINAAIGLAQSGLKQTSESIFSDVMTGYKDANDAKQKELDRINELRLQFGSVIPSNVTDLKTALDLAAPIIDKEQKLKFQKMAKDLTDAQTSDYDIESWATSFAKGEVTIASIPAAIRNQVKVRSDAIRATLEAQGKQEYKDKIVLQLEKKTTDFETQRSLILQDTALTTAEQREMLDYVDSLEQQKNNATANGGKGLFSFLNPAGNQQTTPSSSGGTFGKGNLSKISIDDRIAQLKKTVGNIRGGDILGRGGFNQYLEKQLIQDGYDSQEIAKRTRGGLLDFLR